MHKEMGTQKQQQPQSPGFHLVMPVFNDISCLSFALFKAGKRVCQLGSSQKLLSMIRCVFISYI